MSVELVASDRQLVFPTTLAPMTRAFAIVIALLCVPALAACGSQLSAADAEGAIEGQSHGRLAEPACVETAMDESRETSFRCSAVEPAGRRVKVHVTFVERQDEAFILLWPCVSARTPWRALHQRPELRCGVPLGRRGYWRR
jgi:hypothetical protein